MLVFLLTLSAWAQESRPVILFNPFVSHGIHTEEASFLESLFQSFFSDAGELVYRFENSNPSPVFNDFYRKNPDYVLSGNIYLEKKMRIFTLEIQNTRTGEIKSSTTSHRTSGDIALSAKSLVENIWSARPGRP